MPDNENEVHYIPAGAKRTACGLAFNVPWLTIEIDETTCDDCLDVLAGDYDDVDIDFEVDFDLGDAPIAGEMAKLTPDELDSIDRAKITKALAHAQAMAQAKEDSAASKREQADEEAAAAKRKHFHTCEQCRKAYSHVDRFCRADWERICKKCWQRWRAGATDPTWGVY